jgi:hypothetical protein
MARIADYTIITGHWVVQADQDTIEFPVPDNINLGARSILGFMLDVDNDGELQDQDAAERPRGLELALLRREPATRCATSRKSSARTCSRPERTC